MSESGLFLSSRTTLTVGHQVHGVAVVEPGGKAVVTALLIVRPLGEVHRAGTFN